jgi:hypothetical protein
MKSFHKFIILMLFLSLSLNVLWAETIDRRVTFSEDLNSDGSKEDITVTFTGEKGRDMHDYIININDEEYKGSFPYDGIVSAEIIDIDKGDGQKEILVRFDGETDDVLESFFIYDSSIKKMGEVWGSSVSKIPGDGIVTIFQWMGFWSRDARYRLERSVLVPIVEEYKLDIKSNVAETMVLRAAPSAGSRISATLDAESKIELQKVTIVSDKCFTSDGNERDCEWYYIESEDGESGWIEYGNLIKGTMDLPWAG